MTRTLVAMDRKKSNPSYHSSNDITTTSKDRIMKIHKKDIGTGGNLRRWLAFFLCFIILFSTGGPGTISYAQRMRGKKTGPKRSAWS